MTDHRRSGRSPRKWFYVVAPIASTLFALGAIELGLAVFHPVPFSIEHNMYFEPDPFTGFRLKPDALGHFQLGIVAKANAHGHRDDFVPLARTEGVRRILVLGDSFTVGANVAREHAYPQVLEALLRDSGLSVEVVNASVGGWDPFQYAQYYQQTGRNFSPDLIVIGFFVGNDSYSRTLRVARTRTAIMGRRVRRAVAAERFIAPKVWLYRHSHLARLLLKGEPQQRDATREHCAQFTRQYLRIQRARLGNHSVRSRDLQRSARRNVRQIIRIKALAAKDAIPLLVVLIPDEIQLNAELQQILLADRERDQFDFGMPQSMLAEFFDQAGIEVIDLLPHFRNDARCLYMNDTHWTAAGHHLAASIIHRHLIRLMAAEP